MPRETSYRQQALSRRVDGTSPMPLTPTHSTACKPLARPRWMPRTLHASAFARMTRVGVCNLLTLVRALFSGRQMRRMQTVHEQT